MSDALLLAAGAIEIRPQGGPGETDDLRPDGGFGYLNEQVIWIRHQAMPDSRSALRVPESVGWKSKTRHEKSTASQHNYQVGQAWRLKAGSLGYADCPLSDPLGESPGTVGAAVEILDGEHIRVQITLSNLSGKSLADAGCHICFNHRRAPLLGRRIFARSEAGWVDFGRYVADEPYRRYAFAGARNPSDLPPIVEPALFSETLHPAGDFTAVIGARSATSVMSNAGWPCTDVFLGFGTVAPGAASRRELHIGLGTGGKDEWREKMQDWW